MNYGTYWRLTCAPFDNVPDPKMYWPQNPCLEDAISEVLFAIEEGNECLAVIVGDIGTGKTLALRVLLRELNPERYKVAFLTNPTLTTTQILREIIGQLENKKINTRWKDHLQEEFNQVLFRSAAEGKRIVIFMDEANVLSPATLQGLRLLTNMQDDTQNLVMFVLAGQKELAQKLEKPAMENLYQRIGVYCKVKGMDSEELVEAYMAHRLKQAGSSRRIFTKSAICAIWKYSRGIPRMVNKIGKLCLKAGETNHLDIIDEPIVSSLAHMFKRGFFTEDNTPANSKETGISEDAATPVCPSSELSDSVDYDTLQAKEPLPAENTSEPEPESQPQAFASRTESKVETDMQPEPDLTHGEEITESNMDELIKQIPAEVLDRLSLLEERQLSRLAGQLAAKKLHEDEALRNAGDPIFYWEKMRNEIVMVLQRLSNAGPMRKAEYS